MSAKPRDAAEVLAERIERYREAHLDVVRARLADLAVYAPRMPLERALEAIRASATEFGWDCSRATEDYVSQRKTVRHTPPDKDRAPSKPFEPDTVRRRR